MKPMEVSAAVTYYNIKRDGLPASKESSNFLLLNDESDDEGDDRQLFSRGSSTPAAVLNNTIKIPPPCQRLLKRRDAIVISRNGDLDKIYKFKEKPWRCCRCVTLSSKNKSSTVCDRCHEQRVSNFDDGGGGGDSHFSNPVKNQLRGNCKFMTKHFNQPLPTATGGAHHYVRNECSSNKNKKQVKRRLDKKRDCYGGNCTIV